MRTRVVESIESSLEATSSLSSSLRGEVGVTTRVRL